MRKILNKKGFTLVELLIVIAIIGVLSALLMANFIGVRQRARDAQRKADLRQIQSALELFRSDTGNYPGSLEFGGQLTNTDQPDNNTVYMQKVPLDPINNGYPYTYTSDGSSYYLAACLENASDSQGVDASQLPAGVNTNSGSCSSGAFILLNNP